MSRFLSLCVFTMVWVSVLWAQNLVPNPSFENAWTCPKYFYTEPVNEVIPQWKNPTRGTPDYFNRCADSIVSVPDNFAGSIDAQDGNAYIGIILRETFDCEFRREGVSREYIQVELKQPLKYGQLYCYSMYYALSCRSPFAVDALGVSFTRTRIKTRDAGQILQMPQVTNLPMHVMKNKGYWVELCGIYRARGKEKYLTIGNFFDDVTTSYERLYDETCDSNFVYAYYYIDNVRLFEIDYEFECGCENEFSVGSDWKSDRYDPETGFNTRKTEIANATNTQVGDSNNNTDNNNQHQHSNDSNRNESNSNSNNSNNGFNNSLGDTASNTLDNLDLNKSGIGDSFRLNRIFFEFNSSELLPQSYDEINKLLTLLNQNPRLRIEIRGHTDDVGSKQYNRKLSIARAASVYNYLLAEGIEKSRMKYRGFGNEVPVADNSTEAGRQLNRRVEIVIVEL